MAYEVSEPRYGFSFRTSSIGGKNSTKSINNVNLALGGASEGYTPDQVGIFIDAVAVSLMSATSADNKIINAQRLLEQGA